GAAEAALLPLSPTAPGEPGPAVPGVGPRAAPRGARLSRPGLALSPLAARISGARIHLRGLQRRRLQGHLVLVPGAREARGPAAGGPRPRGAGRARPAPGMAASRRGAPRGGARGARPPAGAPD